MTEQPIELMYRDDKVTEAFNMILFVDPERKVIGVKPIPGEDSNSDVAKATWTIPLSTVTKMIREAL